MAGADDLRPLLEQILQTQREHLAEYRKVSERFAEMNAAGLKIGQQQQRLYRWVVGVGSLVFGSLLLWLWLR